MNHFLLILFTTLLTSTCTSAHAQKKKKDKLDPSFYLYKADWSDAASIDEATYFMESTKESDSLYICRYYNKLGPMIRQESYLDAALSMPNGRFCWYNAKGDLDSIGQVYKQKKDSYWYYYRDGKTYLVIQYEKGKMIEKTDYDAQMKYYADGTQETFAERKIKDSLEKLSADTTFTTVQVEAKYKGGTSGWTNYISNNLKTPERLINVLGKGLHTAIVGFMINKEGATDDVYIIHSVEWSGDREISNLIKDAPKWQPAVQNGRTVLYRMKQSISFQVN